MKFHVEYEGPDGKSYSERVEADTIHQVIESCEHANHSACDITAIVQMNVEAPADLSYIAAERIGSAGMLLHRYDQPEIQRIRAQAQALAGELWDFIEIHNPQPTPTWSERVQQAKNMEIVSDKPLPLPTRWTYFQLHENREKKWIAQHVASSLNHDNDREMHEQYVRACSALTDFVERVREHQGITITIP